MIWPHRKYVSGCDWCLWRWTDRDNDPVLRLHLVKTPWFAVCLHRIRWPDPEPYEHDHPVSFLALVLRGAYVEVRNGQAKARARINFIRATDHHRIVWCRPNTLTLALMGPKVREWGYHTERGWVFWKDYVAA